MSVNTRPYSSSTNHRPLDLRAERNAAVEAARRAAASIREAAGHTTDHRRKRVNDFVTAADQRAQNLIVGHLTEAFPDYAVLAEEGADLAAAPRVPEVPRWIIDPIDGTTNFMHAVSPYAVSIALQRGRSIDLSVLLDVPGDELYTAVRGQGAYLNDQPLQASRAETMREVIVATGFPYSVFDHLERYAGVLQEVIRTAQGVRRHGAASVDLAGVAAGRFGAFFETGLRPWDVAAGALLVEEAGGRVTDYRGRTAIDGQGFLFGGQVLATGGPLHDHMLALLEVMQNVRD